MLKDVLAVAGGFALWSVLWLGGSRPLANLFPGALQEDGSLRHAGALATLLVFAALVSLAAGYVLTLIGDRAGLSWVLGGLLLLVGILVQWQSWSLMPIWYHLIFLALLVPMVWLGARLGT